MTRAVGYFRAAAAAADASALYWLGLVPPLTHARTKARTHARTRTRTHARMHTHAHARTHARTNTHAYAARRRLGCELLLEGSGRGPPAREPGLASGRAGSGLGPGRVRPWAGPGQASGWAGSGLGPGRVRPRAGPEAGSGPAQTTGAGPGQGGAGRGLEAGAAVWTSRRLDPRMSSIARRAGRAAVLDGSRRCTYCCVAATGAYFATYFGWMSLKNFKSARASCGAQAAL